jgi:heptosyltransferase III
LKNPKKILIIIQRSNGDVFLSSNLISVLYKYYKSPDIDLLINDDTYPVGKLLPNIKFIHQFSYKKKIDNRWLQEKNLIKAIFRKYDLSINLTASDRSVFYALFASRNSISAIENDKYKSWWKRLFLSHYYYFDSSKHILVNNSEPLNLLKIKHKNIQKPPIISEDVILKVKTRLKDEGVSRFLIFHPSAQYNYKIYPKFLRNKLLKSLNTIGLPIFVTGGNSKIDLQIKKEIPNASNIYNLIGKTSLEEYFVLSQLSLAYVGMDTLNMHIAASQNKRIFAIFGSTNLSMWSPWSNELQRAAIDNKPIQNYDNITIFQADMLCVACGKAGCDDNHGHSNCLDNISPYSIFNEIKDWQLNLNSKSKIPIQMEIESQQRKVVLYIVYGEDQTYYDGAVFSFLTFQHWLLENNQIEIVVLTEKPELFSDYPVKTLSMSEEQKNEWSLNGQYHFRIKNRGLAFVLDQLKLKDSDKILFFDTDTYFHKSPLPLFDLIQSNQAVFYLNEGLIYDRTRFDVYVKNLEGRKIEIDGECYELSRKSAMWGSLMMGIMADMRPSLDWADKLMVRFFDLVPAHTIEPFSFSETLLRKYKIVEGKKFVSLYSTSRKKEHAKNILSNFFHKNRELHIDDKVHLAQKVKIKRPFSIILRQRIKRIMSK